MPSAWDMAGAAFFRVRSFAPLPLIYFGVRQSWDSHLSPGLGGPAVDAALNAVGVALCVLGGLVRFVTVGFVPAGTSSQSRVLQAHALNTEGPYAVVRHPLYVGNFFITFGVLCIAHEPWAWGLGLGYFALSHLFIVRAEEALLRRTYGEVYEAWVSRVPAWIPALSKLGRMGGPFAWKRAIQREVNPNAAWMFGVTLLLLWERFVRSELPAKLGTKYLAVLAVVLVLLIANKVWKKASRA